MVLVTLCDAVTLLWEFLGQIESYIECSWGVIAS